MSEWVTCIDMAPDRGLFAAGGATEPLSSRTRRADSHAVCKGFTGSACLARRWTVPPSRQRGSMDGCWAGTWRPAGSVCASMAGWARGCSREKTGHQVSAVRLIGLGRRPAR